MKRLFVIAMLLILAVTTNAQSTAYRSGATPDYQNNGWKEWYFSNGNVACKIYQRPGENGAFALHLTPEAEVCISYGTCVGWGRVETEGNYDVYKLWEYKYNFKIEQQGFANWTSNSWYEWVKPYGNSEKVLKIAKDWSEMIYPEDELSWYNHARLKRVSQEAYKRTVKAQEENLARDRARYGGGNYGNGGYSSGSSSSGSSSGGSSSVYSKCRICNGSGRCTSCRGTGTGTYTYGGTSHSTCSSCNGSGRCFNCYGTGRQ